MQTEYASACACLVVSYIEETYREKLFIIELTKFLSAGKLKLLKKYSNYWSINCVYQKGKIIRDEEGNVVQILNASDIKAIYNR